MFVRAPEFHRGGMSRGSLGEDQPQDLAAFSIIVMFSITRSSIIIIISSITIIIVIVQPQDLAAAAAAAKAAAAAAAAEVRLFD